MKMNRGLTGFFFWKDSNRRADYIIVIKYCNFYVSLMQHDKANTMGKGWIEYY